MRLLKLELRHFRNYRELNLEFSGSLAVFVGENAQGKTNLLEAIYLLAMGRSYRTSRDHDLIGWGESYGRVRSLVSRATGDVTVEVLLKDEGPKEFKVAGERIRRQTDLLGTVNVVVFSPDDLQLVKGSPSERRRFLDVEIAQVSPAYRYHFTRYQRVLRQRNNLLKAIQGGQASFDALEAWDPQLVADGAWVVAKRAQVVKRISHWSRLSHKNITGGKEELSLLYRPFFQSEGEEPSDAWENPSYVEQRFYESLENVRKEERIRGITLVGPQRDDLAFAIDGSDLRFFGSQGQQRTAVLACKLAELEYMKEEAGEYPILLLDDVMSELDDSRRERFMHTVSGRINTFITTTNLRGVTDDVLNQATCYEIRQGTVTPR